MTEVLSIGPGGLAFGRPDELSLKAIDVLLALAPEEVWPLLENLSRPEARRLLENLKGFTSFPGEGLAIPWHSWSAHKLVGLVRLLFRAYPPEDDPPFEGGCLSTEDSHRLLRWQVLRHFTRSYATTELDSVEEAKTIHPQAMEFIERIEAQGAASSLLGDIKAQGGAGISVAEACRLLDDEHFRLIRTPADLLEVVVEELGEIEKDVGNDHAMLYQPTSDGKGEKRRREEALQAYVLRRLKDRLPGRVLDPTTEVLLDRETEIKGRRRTDIRVIAPVIGSRQLAKTVIEVKWSDNSSAERGVSTGLTEQLGKKYLLKEGLAQGVFLVGWIGELGTWRRSAGPRPKERSVGALQRALQDQADNFCNQHKELDIRVIVWDLER